MSSPGYCAVCGRTFLVGESVRPYVSAEGRQEVCELCAGRAAERGWLPADQDGAEERLRADAARKPNFLTKLFTRPDREEEPGEAFSGSDPERESEAPPRSPAVPEPADPYTRHEPVASHELDTERYDVEAAWDEPEPAPRSAESEAEEDEPDHAERPNALRRLADLLSPSSERESVDPRTNLEAVRERGGPPTPAPAPPSLEQDERPDPAGRGMRPRRLQPDLSPGTRFERAIVRFNAGEAGRTVAGLTRTLGAPSVSVGDLAGAEEIVRVTVAWELTWYQWGVDLGDELRPVYELAKGFEIAQIDSAARQWNASAHDGRVVMVAPGRRPAENGRPVHR